MNLKSELLEVHPIKSNLCSRTKLSFTRRSSVIISICKICVIRVQNNALGHGFLEAVYQEALEIEFQRQGIPYEREKELKIQYEGVELKQTYKADFVCFGKIIVELKAVNALDDAHRSQVYNYLHATGYKLGLLLNFGNSDELEKERIVL